MACSLCNDGRAWEEFEIKPIALDALAHSSEACRVCAILQSTLKDEGFVDDFTLSLSYDKINQWVARSTDGIKALISKGGARHTTDDFVLRNLHGK